MVYLRALVLGSMTAAADALLAMERARSRTAAVFMIGKWCFTRVWRLRNDRYCRNQVTKACDQGRVQIPSAIDTVPGLE